jgi:hypothetical protein
VSIATESLSLSTTSRIHAIEKYVREIAKEYGVRVRRNPYNGIDVKYPNGEKKHYLGWISLRHDLIKAFDLAD